MDSYCLCKMILILEVLTLIQYNESCLKMNCEM